MPIDRAALAAGSIRLASGISFLVDPVRANRLWGDPDEPAPTARLLLRSMGYRDALIGGLLAVAALRGRSRPARRDERAPRDEALTAADRPRRRGRRYRRRALGCDAAKPEASRAIGRPAARAVRCTDRRSHAGAVARSSPPADGAAVPRRAGWPDLSAVVFPPAR